MDKQPIIPVDSTTYFEENLHLTESEQIWRFIGSYYLLFSKKKIIIFLFCIIGALIGFTYAFLKEKKYTAEVKFTSNIEDNNNISGYIGIAQQFGLISGGGTNNAFSGDNLMELMRTPSLIEKTLFTPITVKQQRILIIDYYIQSKGIKKQWKKLNSILNSYTFNSDLTKPDYLRDSILKILDKDIAAEISIIKENKDLDFISVKMTDKDSVIAKVFTEMLVKTVSDYYVDFTTAKYKENIKVFQAKADSLSRNFGERLSTVASTQDINVNPSKQISSVPLQKQRINIETDNAVYQEVIKNLELSKIQLQKSTPFIQIIETPKYPLEEVKTSKLISILIGFIVGGLLVILFLFFKTEWIKLTEKLKKTIKAYYND